MHGVASSAFSERRAMAGPPMNATPTAGRAAASGSETSERQATIALLPDQLNLAPRTAAELIADADARRHVAHPLHGIPFDATESALLHDAFRQEMHRSGFGGGDVALAGASLHWEHPASAVLYTTTGLPVAVGYDRLVVGDDGAWLELTDTHLLSRPVPYASRSAQSRATDDAALLGATPHQIYDTPLVIWQQIVNVRLAPRRPGAWYLDPRALRLSP